MNNTKLQNILNKKCTRLRFTYEDDLALLKEFLNVNPIINPHGGETIQQHLMIVTGKNFLIKTLKKHLMLLLEMFLKKIKVDEIRSGFEEPQCERNALLHEVSAICQENNYNFTENRKRPLTKDQQITQLGKKIRDDCARSFHEKSQTVLTESPALDDHDYDISSDFPGNAELKDNLPNNIEIEETISIYTDIPSSKLSDASIPPSTSMASNKTDEASKTPKILKSTIAGTNNKILGPIRRRINRKEPLRKNALAYLTDKNERENAIRIKELEIEQRRVALEERKVSIDEKRLQIEEKRIQLDEKKLELEHKERIERLEIEKTKNKIELEQKMITNQLLVSQQQLIDNLLKK